MKKMDSFQLKLIMAMIMVLDHLHYIPGLLGSNTEMILHMITRCVGVWFAYVAVEGIKYTRNKFKYNMRLFIWAGIMYGVDSLINFMYSSKGIHIDNNIFLTLAVGVLMLNIFEFGIDKFKEKGKIFYVGSYVVKSILALAVMFVGFMYCEGGATILPFMLVTYFTRNSVKLRNVLYVVLMLLMAYTSYQPYPTMSETISMFLYNSDWLFISVLPFIYLYNGKRGLNNKFSKYFFYVFYPAHLFIIATIGYFVS